MLLKPSSSSRRRLFSAIFATVFEVDFIDSLNRRPANQNSYHQTSPRRKSDIYFSHRCSLDSGQPIASLHQRSQFADFRMRKRALSRPGSRRLDPNDYSDIVSLRRTIHPKPGFSCLQQHVSGSQFMDRGREGDNQNRRCPLMPVPRVGRNDDNGPPSFVGWIGMKIRPPDLASLRKSLRRRHVLLDFLCEL